MVEDYTAEIKNTNRNISFDSSTSKELESTSILADQNRIQQVISNLMDNAVKFTPEGAITVTTETDDKHNHIIVKVKDTGEGIDSAVLPKLFTKFVTKSDKGTGIGLYVCKGIIEAHGGKIWAENNTEGGSGATFSISLPLAYS
jgi:two-component system, OmpR family, sensor histidine kinase VicK